MNIPQEAIDAAIESTTGHMHHDTAHAILTAALPHLFPGLTATRDQHGVQVWRRLPDGGRRVPVTHAELADLMAGLLPDETGGQAADEADGPLTASPMPLAAAVRTAFLTHVTRPVGDTRTLTIYRDRSGDLWAVTPGGRVFLAIAPECHWEGPASRTWDDAAREFGPMTPLPIEEAAKHHAGLFDLIDRLMPEDGTR